MGDNALLKLAPLLARLGERQPDFDMTPEPAALLRALEGDGDDPAAALERVREADPFLALLVEPMLGVTVTPTQAAASEKINVIPSQARIGVDCRVPPGLGEAEARARVEELLGPEGYRLEFSETVEGNRSPMESELMDAIGDWVAEHDPGAEVVPTILPGFTDSRWFRVAFPACVAYGFFPQTHMTLHRLRAADPRRRRAHRRARPGLRRPLLPRPCAAGARMTGEKLRLGGMALRNGLLVHGPTHWAAAVRARDGDVRTASGPKPRVRGLDAVPGARGLARLAEALAVIPLVKRALPDARLPFQDARVIGVAAGAAAAGSVLRRRGSGGLGAEAAAGALSLAPALFALRGGELASYHGVEHKAIAAYEQDAPDAADAAKEHDRCGSNLVAPMLAANVAGSVLVRRVLGRAGPGCQRRRRAVLDGRGGRGVRVVRAPRRHPPRACSATSRP